MGKSLVAAALLVFPAAAHSQHLLVEYQGVVSSIDRASSLAELPPYTVGDAVSGTLLIDLARAPADRLPDDPQIGRYYGGSPVSDFILGASHPAGNRGDGDLVVVYDDWDPPSTGAAKEDGIFINDRSIGTDGESNFVLGLQRPNPFGQIFSSDDLPQSFAAENEPGTTLWGYIERGFGEFRRIVNFTLDRLSVTPRVCRAP